MPSARAKVSPRFDADVAERKVQPSGVAVYEDQRALREPPHGLRDIDEDIDEVSEAFPYIPLPFPRPRSGLYTYFRRFVLPPIPVKPPIPIPRPVPELERAPDELVYDDDVSAITFYQREEVRLDIDGRYPQMAISGTRFGLLTIAAHWVASVTKIAPNKYEGPIWFKDGSPGAIPHTRISAVVTGGLFSLNRKLAITFSGGGAATFTRTYAYESSYYHKVAFEYDTVEGATAVTSIDTHAHPNRPTSLPNETLTLEMVYRRAGFNVSMSGGDSIIPLADSGANGTWSDQEMHDAMQLHWSRFGDKPQWSLWVLFAALHDFGASLGGIMFDDIGPNHRQGTAIFSDSFIANAPAGDPSPAAYVQRMRFWTAAHEMGHALNLAHSWQKAASPTLPGNPWIPLVNDTEARSFMNYPYFVAGGEAAFFADFDYRFIDPELLFMRHAPSRFVQMGNENWFSNHGFEEAARNGSRDYRLVLSTNARENRFPYLAPPVIEVALVNASGRPKLVSDERIAESESLTLIINPERGEPRRWQPFLRHCGDGAQVLLHPGGALFDSIMVGTGRNGWDMAEPGRYTVQAVLTVDGQDVYSNRLCVSVEPPRSREEERVASELFTPEVGQVLAVNGTRALDHVNRVLEAALALDENPVSQLAAAALAAPLGYRYKLLEFGDPVAGAGPVPEQRIGLVDPEPMEAKRLLRNAADGKADVLVHAMGHARYLREAPKLAAAIGGGGTAAAKQSPQALRASDAPDPLPVSDDLAETLRVKAAGLSR